MKDAHILLQTPDGNISRCMRHLNSVYTQRYNRRHGFDGQLFRGRYKSIVVCNDSHLLQLVRYIHKNPVKAGMVKDMPDYEWSSYKGYLSYAKKWNWLHKDYIFPMITPKKRGRLKPFIEFMQEDDSEEITRLFSLILLCQIRKAESSAPCIESQDLVIVKTSHTAFKASFRKEVVHVFLLQMKTGLCCFLKHECE